MPSEPVGIASGIARVTFAEFGFGGFPPLFLANKARMARFLEHLQRGPPYGPLLQNLKVWCKNPSPAGPLNKPLFCIPLQIPPLSLHSWRPSISPSKHGSHHIYFLSLSSLPPNTFSPLSPPPHRRPPPCLSVGDAELDCVHREAPPLVTFPDRGDVDERLLAAVAEGGATRGTRMPWSPAGCRR
jgi:hypothetical protein